MDLSRPLALCALNFDLADVSMTDSSGEVIFIPGTRPNGRHWSLPAPAELVEEEIRLCKIAYNPDSHSHNLICCVPQEDFDSTPLIQDTCSISDAYLADRDCSLIEIDIDFESI